MKTALLFPGQGAQYVGMGRGLHDAFPEAREVFERADAALGLPLSRLLFEGPEAELRLTHNTQPAILVHSIAAWAAARALLPPAQFAAGHSLGEYSALVAAGALQFEDAVRVVRVRGELMLRAGQVRPGTMAAILNLPAAEVEAACAEAGGTVVPANLNSPSQIVISGEVDAVERAMERCKAHGAKRALRLEVSGAFHSPLMASAAEGLWAHLERLPIQPAAVPVVANVSGQPVQQPEEIRDALSRQVLGAVLWEPTVRLLVGRGVRRYVELGPGKVLRGLVKTVDGTAELLGVDGPADVEALRVARSGAEGSPR
ncbi:MAG TPA: ACP S-malonyltransferase [Candidatus Saccharimonadales bacterium]|nr:ACP S-malonyltransferase [Candidatus Saccharimonadales bacterium]